MEIPEDETRLSELELIYEHNYSDFSEEALKKEAKPLSTPEEALKLMKKVAMSYVIFVMIKTIVNYSHVLVFHLKFQRLVYLLKMSLLCQL